MEVVALPGTWRLAWLSPSASCPVFSAAFGAGVCEGVQELVVVELLMSFSGMDAIVEVKSTASGANESVEPYSWL